MRRQLGRYSSLADYKPRSFFFFSFSQVWYTRSLPLPVLTDPEDSVPPTLILVLDSVLNHSSHFTPSPSRPSRSVSILTSHLFSSRQVTIFKRFFSHTLMLFVSISSYSGYTFNHYLLDWAAPTILWEGCNSPLSPPSYLISEPNIFLKASV
jgi:hypothetical protein